ncbi:NTP transferase domain-containing protein [Candidatus Parcubacteria bacterium]|jgi:bifunctional UDP-N-acetylglucosamine pyrophosphorylase / glucosamine-1-phosphate N-acetyltransferase|nr:NTP transferase domain-containing protein [Candidatus Parcubacteria bacterium]MBT3948800.1 NTP transferase domain-containing protein [Candidatus Parcubacteria bacterium]
MSKKNLNNIGIVILAAGKGTRLNCTDKPKVMLEIGNKPIVSYIVETLFDAGFTKDQIVLVVGFENKKVKDYFGDTVTYSDQEEQLGTAHATYVGMEKLSKDIETVLVMGGDDSAFYTKETLLNFINKHVENNATLSLLTSEVESPEGLGRVIRNDNDEFAKVLEKEQLDDEQKNITEISTGTYCFNKKWFEHIFPEMKQIDGLGELGLPKSVEIAIDMQEKIQAIKLKNKKEWFGINTVDELKKADDLKKNF